LIIGMYRAYLRTDIVESSNNGEDLADAVEAVAGSAEGFCDTLEKVDLGAGAVGYSQHDVINTDEATVLPLLHQAPHHLILAHLG